MMSAWFDDAKAGGRAEEDLRPDRAAAERVLEVAVLGAEARGVGEDAEVAGGLERGRRARTAPSPV